MSMLAALKGCYDRLAEDQDSGIAPFGYSEENISFALVLSSVGTLVGQPTDLRLQSGKRLAPRRMLVPQSFKRPGITPRSFFLWDKVSYALGVGQRPKDRTEAEHRKRLAEEHHAFKAFHATALAASDDEGLNALLAFLQRWAPEQIDMLDHKDDLLQNPNLIFRLDGERRYLHQRPAARAIWARLLAQGSDGEGICLISGERAPLARLHPSIKGVRGAQSSGASIVSFNLDAFTSYGKDQGENAPVSEVAAFAYTTALNHMLRSGSRNRVQVGDASTVFWAESHAPAEEALVWSLFEPPAESEADTDQREARFDAGEAAKLRDVLNQIAKGRPLRGTPRQNFERERASSSLAWPRMPPASPSASGTRTRWATSPAASASTTRTSRSSRRPGAHRPPSGVCSTRPPSKARPRTSPPTSPARSCARS